MDKKENFMKEVEELQKQKRKNVKRTSELIKWLLNFSLLFVVLLSFYSLNPKKTGYVIFQPFNIVIPSIFGLLFLFYFLCVVLRISK